MAFLPELRQRFIETLELTPEQVIFPEDPEYFVALGAALLSEKKESIKLEEILYRLKDADETQLNVSKLLPPLFNNEAEYENFNETKGNSVKRNIVGSKVVSSWV